MHILYLHQYFCPPGGSGNNRSYELARAWVQAGHQVTMLTSAAYFPPHLQNKTAWNCDGIDVVVVPVQYAHMMGMAARVRAFLRFYALAKRLAAKLPQPDVIYASSTPLSVGELGRKLSRRWQVPFVFETVDVWPDVPIGMGLVPFAPLRAWLHRRTNRIYAAASAIVALSDGMVAQVRSHGVPAEKVNLAYNGTNLEAFPYVERPVRPQLHVIYAGTVGRANGADVIPRLCARLLALGRADVRVTILGGGNALHSVKALAEELQTTNLQFLDTVPKEEVAPLLASADVGLVTFAPFPVLEANSANKFYDYLSSGLPIVINYRGWQAGYLDANDCGKSSDQGDLEGLVQNILWLADHPQERPGMGMRARKLAEARFDRTNIAAEILEILGRVRRS